MTPRSILICFAVKEEAKFFSTAALHSDKPVNCVITGMGQRNAVNSVGPLLETLKPELVITCGFAGALNPNLKLGKIIFNEDLDAGLGVRLLAAGAEPAMFHFANKVAVTAAEKQALWESTGQEAVEMESSAIRALCVKQKIPSATVRVISDEAGEDLPLDFNALMTAAHRINFLKLAGTVLIHPGKISPLLAFQKRTVFAAKKLGATLETILRADAR